MPGAAAHSAALAGWAAGGAGRKGQLSTHHGDLLLQSGTSHQLRPSRRLHVGRLRRRGRGSASSRRSGRCGSGGGGWGGRCLGFRLCSGGCRLLLQSKRRGGQPVNGMQERTSTTATAGVTRLASSHRRTACAQLRLPKPHLHDHDHAEACLGHAVVLQGCVILQNLQHVAGAGGRPGRLAGCRLGHTGQGERDSGWMDDRNAWGSTWI